MKNIFTIFSLFLLFAFCQNSFAQTDVMIGQQVEVRTNDGNSYAGEVTKFTDEDIVIMTRSIGEITLKRSIVKHVIFKGRKGAMDDQGFPIDYHNSTHYLLNSSAFSLKKGQSYYENIGVFFNSYSVGVTDNFTMSGGLEFISPLFDKRVPSIYLSPKYSIPFGERAGGISIGSTVLAFFDNGDVFSVGVIQGAVTAGSRNNNFTIGTGIGFSFDDGLAEGVLPFNLSGMFRVSNKISVVTDNFIIAYDNFDGGFGLLSAGVRIHFSKNGAALNLGLWRPTEDWGDVLALPFISATIPIN